MSIYIQWTLFAGPDDVRIREVSLYNDSFNSTFSIISKKKQSDE